VGRHGDIVGFGRVAVACSLSRLRLDGRLTCSKEAKQARASIFASCRSATKGERELSPRRTNQTREGVVLTRRVLPSANLPLVVCFVVARNR